MDEKFEKFEKKIEKKFDKVNDKIATIEKEVYKNQINVIEIVKSVDKLIHKLDSYYEKFIINEVETSKNSDNRLFTADLVKHIVKWLVIAVLTAYALNTTA